ncbi:MAG TPA: YCF48-related protein [Ignavibacteriaceae bacterium]|nr:YCF48-related protein [Ignavibacteriaceae bacterium]
MIKRYFFLLFLLTGIINAQSGWFSLSSGTGNTLHSVDFMTADYVIAVGDAGTILLSTDAGAGWAGIPSGTAQNLNCISVINNSTAVIVGDAGTILRTTDAGTSWQIVPSDVTDNLLAVSFNGVDGIAGGTSQTIIFSTDAGASWTTSQTGFFGGGFYGVQMLDADNAYVAGENSIFQPMFGASVDGGQNWNYTAFYLNSNEGKLYGIHFFDVNNGLASAAVWTGEGAVSSTTDGGLSWSTLPFFDNALYTLNFPANQSDIGYAAGAAGLIIKTTDGGSSWDVQTSGTSNILYGIVFADELTGYTVGENGTILKTVSGGVIPVEFTSFNANVDEMNVRLIWQTSTETNNSGFFVQRKAGNVWENLNFIQGYGTTSQSHTYDYIDNLSDFNYRGKIYYRLKQVDYDGSLNYSSTESVIYEPKPNDFALDQNYPNPFNPATSIKFSMPEGAHVKLTVYDLLGNEVETLLDQYKPAGTYSVKFNGSELTSGIYIYRLQAGDFVSTKRMALIK